MHGLDLLLARQSHVMVLRVLYHADGPLTGREVERRTGLSNRGAMLALESLVELSAVRRYVEGNAYRYTLNPDHYLVSRVLKAAFEAEDLFWTDVRKLVRKIVHPRPMAVVAAGPLARDETLAWGRMELVMLFSSGRSRIRAFASTEELREAIQDRYGLPSVCTLLDVNIMDREEYDALWKRVAREGILLFGNLP
ncbi:MAG TPA: hypothetical protein ENG36_02040 [Lentisphaerae bacterium]|nr:MAG: hypothetical protein DRP22_03410 [Verrucomicrobiota bacterium]HDL77532.1 hypothetical protein [Lentisphaerota bacterium]